MEENRIEGQIFFRELNAVIQLRTLAKANLWQETILELGLALSQDPIVEIS